MDDLGPVLSLVLGYWESLVVGPVYDRDRQGFQHRLGGCIATYSIKIISLINDVHDRN